MRRILMSATIVLCIYIILPPKITHAAEINPDPSSYSYGSTSEYSAATTTQPASESLADTGSSQEIIQSVAGLLVIAGLAAAITSRRNLSTTKYSMRR